MKKHLYILLALTAIAVASCSKAASDDGSDIDTSGFTVFDVSTEQIDILGSGSFRDKWAEGTLIGVFSDDRTDDVNVQYILKRSGIGKSEAVFYGPLMQGKKILAYVPYSADKVLEDGKMPVNLAIEQEYVGANTATRQFLQYSSDIYAVSDEKPVLDFRYPYGLIAIQIQLDETINVKEMTLSCDHGIAGQLLLNDREMLEPSSISSKSISLKCATPVSSRVGEKYTSFYFVVPPGQYAPQTLTLDITAVEESMTLKLNGLEVKRVSGSDFPVCSIVVKTGGIPSFETVPGYLDE